LVGSVVGSAGQIITSDISFGLGSVSDEAYLGWRFDLVGVGHTIV
jgi:hypothetical protein